MSAGLDVSIRGTHSPQSLSPGVRVKGAARSAAVWIVGLAAVLIATIAIVSLQTAEQEDRPLHFNSYQATGARAFVETLRSHGAQVDTTTSLADAQRLASQVGTTVVVTNPGVLPSTAAKSLTTAVRQAGNDLVLIEPESAVTDYDSHIRSSLSTPTSSGGTSSSTPLQPGCSDPVATRAGTVSGDAGFYSATGITGGVTCYRDAEGSPDFGAYVRAPLGSGSVSVLGSANWIANRDFDEQGNAALSIGVAGTHAHVVYYWADENEFTALSSDDGLLGQVPPWFLAAVAWSFFVLLGLALWRGRRLGPLAVERLPVVVPPIETVDGRAALLQRSRARSHALSSLRAGALLSLARTCGVPPAARSEEIVRAVSERTTRSPQQVDWALVSGTPGSDRELVQIAQTMSAIEREITPR